MGIKSIQTGSLCQTAKNRFYTTCVLQLQCAGASFIKPTKHKNLQSLFESLSFTAYNTVLGSIRDASSVHSAPDRRKALFTLGKIVQLKNALNEINCVNMYSQVQRVNGMKLLSTDLSIVYFLFLFTPTVIVQSVDSWLQGTGIVIFDMPFVPKPYNKLYYMNIYIYLNFACNGTKLTSIR